MRQLLPRELLPGPLWSEWNVEKPREWVGVGWSRVGGVFVLTLLLTCTLAVFVPSRSYLYLFI